MTDQQPPAQWAGEGDPPLDIQADPPAPASLADRIRAQVAEKKRGFHIDLQIPTYDIVVRYKPVKGKTIEQIAKRKADERYGKVYTLALDVLIAACDRVLIRDSSHPAADAEGLAPFETVFELEGDQPVKLNDPRLADALGYDAGTAREIVDGLFPTQAAVLADYRRLDVWMSDVDADVARDTEGE